MMPSTGRATYSTVGSDERWHRPMAISSNLLSSATACP
jgi:hypothetical protein